MKPLRILLLLLACAIVTPAFADKKEKNSPKRPDRKEWMAKMKEANHKFLAEELKLNSAQKEDFFAVYDRMLAERMHLEEQCREMERAIHRKGKNATEKEINDVINEQFTLEERLSKLEQKYLPELRKVLSPSQLLRLKHTEREWHCRLMQQHGKRNKAHKD